MKFCQNCKQQNLPEAQFCRFCASPLSAGSQNQSNFQQQQWNQGVHGNFAHPSAGASGRAIASLLLSICGLVLCCALTSVPGTILGWMEVNAIKQGRSSPAGMTMAQIGLWGGAIISVLVLLFYGFQLLVLMSNAMMVGGGMYY
ncbi:MAG: DUF4190 domain-containing protein [Acidobacteriota bacterium]|nr:DUF4190 domain-containing protein [Acidobacteriota bacterium]